MFLHKLSSYSHRDFNQPFNNLLNLLVAEHLLVDDCVIDGEEVVLGGGMEVGGDVFMTVLVSGNTTGGHFIAVVVGYGFIVEKGKLGGI